MEKTRQKQLWVPKKKEENQIIKVLIADPIGLLNIDKAKNYIQEEGSFFYEGDIPADKSESGIYFSYQPHLTPDEIQQKIKEYSGIIVGPKSVPAGTKFGVRIGAGTNNFPEKEWEDKGNIVMNTPGINTDATAEFVIKALLRLMAHTDLDKAHNMAKTGQLYSNDLSKFYTHELAGKRLAIIGVTGNIGQKVAKLAKAFDMQVVGWGRSFTKAQADAMGIEYAEDINTAMKGADAVSLNVAQAEETKSLIKKEHLDLMNNGAVVVNAARGPIVDAEGLKKAIKERRISGFVADADLFKNNHSNSPLAPYQDIALKFNNNLNLLAIPHFGGDTTQEARENGAIQAIKQMTTAIRTGKIINPREKSVELVATMGKYQNLTYSGAEKPSHIGAVTSVDIVGAVNKSRVPLKQAAETLNKLLGKNHVNNLSPLELEELMKAANVITHKLPTSRMVASVAA